MEKNSRDEYSSAGLQICKPLQPGLKPGKSRNRSNYRPALIRPLIETLRSSHAGSSLQGSPPRCPPGALPRVFVFLVLFSACCSIYLIEEWAFLRGRVPLLVCLAPSCSTSYSPWLPYPLDASPVRRSPAERGRLGGGQNRRQPGLGVALKEPLHQFIEKLRFFQIHRMACRRNDTGLGLWDAA
jgi:hypothetical protein